MSIRDFTTRKKVLILMLCIGIIQIAGYYLAGILASPDGRMAVPQPDTLLYCQAARRIVEGHPFSFSVGTAVSTGTTSVLYPFILSVPYALGATGDSLFMAGFWLNALFYLVFLFGWGQAFWHWLERPGARLAAAILLSLSGQPAFCAMAQSDIGCWMAVSALLAWGLSVNKPAIYGPALILAPWIRPEGMICVVAFGTLFVATLWMCRKEVGHPRAHTPIWLILILSILSSIGVFVLNYILTGHAQFSSVANKGYFKQLPFSQAVVQTTTDFLQLINSYLLGLSTSSPRHLILPVLLAAIFIWLGIFVHPWRRPQTKKIGILLLAAGGGILTVAQSGWQGTNYDRYLVWTLPLLILFFAEGLVSFTTRYLRSFPSFFIPPAVCILFFAGTAFASICQFNYGASVTDRYRLFAKEIDTLLPPTASVASFGTSGIAYKLNQRPYHNLSGIYSPEFANTKSPAVFEILKNKPSTRFDYWVLFVEEPVHVSDTYRTACYGENVLTGPDGFEVRQANWSAYDNALSPHVTIPQGKHLVCRVDVGYQVDENASAYEIIDRYGRPPADPFLIVDDLNGTPTIDAARLLVGGDAMTLPLQPDKETLVVMRTYPQHVQTSVHSSGNISSTYTFANPLKLNVRINEKDIGPILVSYATNGFSDVSFTLPKTGDPSPCRLSLLGDHISAGYWFFQ